jgi:hypothetical protein
MKKMTPMILVILMLTSFLSAVDVYELQDESNNEETSARAGADPEMVYITSPRETTTVDGETTNELLAGEDVDFKAYIRNGGDADLTNMQYQVKIYIDQNGQRGPIATGANGDLSWENNKAICANNCQTSNLAPGDFLNGGESTLVNTDGTDMEWTPSTGNYIMVVTLTSQVLGDPGNDEMSISITVRDYFDMDVSVTWLDATGNPIPGSVEGVTPVDFQITASMTGSTVTNVRTTTVAVTVTGGTYTGPNQVILGEQFNVVTNDDGLGNVTTADRFVIGDNGQTPPGLATGVSDVYTVTPPSDGEYTVSVALESYVVYDGQSCATQLAICERTVADYDDEDEFMSNNQDMIGGSATTFHDIALSNFYMMPIMEEGEGEGDEDEQSNQGDSYGGLGGEITQSLSPGMYNLVAEAFHVSSSTTPIYEWHMVFTITQDGVSTTLEAYDCPELNYNHMYLGVATDKTNAETFGTACASYQFGQGDYIVDATVVLNGSLNEETSVVDTKTVDMSNSNNGYDFDVNFINYAPQILSLKSNLDSGIAGEDRMTFIAEVFDIEGDEIAYAWADRDGNNIDCEESTCEVDLRSTMVPTYRVVVTVSDASGGSTFTSLDVGVSNKITESSADLANDVQVVYGLVYKGSDLSVGFTDMQPSAMTVDQCAGEYTPFASVSMMPSTTFDSSAVESQSLTVHFPDTAGVLYAWLELNGVVTEIASGQTDEVSAGIVGYTYDFPSSADMLPQGTVLHLINQECQLPDPPSSTVSFTVTQLAGAELGISYTATGQLTGETVRITVCATQVDCETPEVVYDRVETDNPGVTFKGMHGVEYHVSAQMCNQFACGDATTIDRVADGEVAAVTATDVTIANSGDTWAVTWKESSVDADIAGWYVCYNKGEFSATQMELMMDSSCAMVAQATSDSTGMIQTTINQYTTVETTQVHFAVVPYDVVGNIAYGSSTDSILYDRQVDNTDTGDGTITTDDEASSGVPTWTWGVIGAVVVVAFIVGAFILSRGDSEDDDDKEWDY